MTSVFNSDPTISVIISTLNRANDLSRTLDSFRWQTYRDKFEVIVVNGPSTDHTQQVIDSWTPQIRAAVCPTANLSLSRNIGIRISSADIIAFIDDDSIPEPEWLEQIARAYRDPEVAAVGGRVYDHTGFQFQCEYCMTDRFGNATTTPSRPMPQRSFPSSFVFPHLLGTNSSFRRDVLVQIGGLDEEFDYYLDETDLCLRVVDKGYLIRQLDCAYVHHKFAPSAIRDKNRVLRNYYSVLKNKIYFCRKHSQDYCRPSKILEEQERFIESKRAEINSLVEDGLLTISDVEKFEQDLQRAIAIGQSAPIPQSAPLSIGPTTQGSSLVPFPTFAPKGGTLTIILVTQDYPPDQEGGIATFNKDLAVALASMGHRVHVLCRSSDSDRVEFDAGTWIHRLRPRNAEQPPAVRRREIPAHIWNWSATARNEAHRIAAHRRIDIVEAPIWDCQGLAFLLEGSWPLVTSLQTSLKFWLDSHPELLADRKWMKSFGSPMLNAERELMEGSNGIRAISRAIHNDIQRAYGIRFRDGHVFFAPLGLANASAPTKIASKPAGSEDTLTILFVGRLEHRKGIDVLLTSIPLVLARRPNSLFRIIGDDTLPGPSGETYRRAFEQNPEARGYSTRVRFEGRVDESTLSAAYASCDVFVAPSRYESFGLVFLEAMRQGKPVIGCQVGGMTEIIQPDVAGLLVPPDDPDALADAIVRLTSSEDLRRAYGEAGRQLFQEQFTAAIMAEKSIDLYTMARHRPPFRRPLKISYINGVCVKYDAISNAIVEEIRALQRSGYHDLKLYTMKCDYDDIPFEIVTNEDGIIGSAHFEDSDLVIFQFGIFSPLFDILGRLSPRAKSLVVFQNITPREVAEPKDHAVIEKSIAQLALIRFADRVVCPSETNLLALRQAGIATQATLLPLAVQLDYPAPLEKPSFSDDTVRIVFVGRFVRAKGPQDLLTALAACLEKHPGIRARVDLIGNLSFSSPDLLQQLKSDAQQLVTRNAHRLSIEFHGNASEHVKQNLLREADIFALPTYHEGFCVPIVEAIGSGCKVITYNNSNAALIGNGLAQLVPTGDVVEFARALGGEIALILSDDWRENGYSSYRASAVSHLAQFSPASVDKRFVELIEEFTGATCLMGQRCDTQEGN